MSQWHRLRALNSFMKFTLFFKYAFGNNDFIYTLIKVSKKMNK